MKTKLTKAFYRQDTLEVAQKLLGKILVHRIGGRELTGRIVETEAYVRNDPACHADRGMTPRNEPMFAAGGISYVYFIYGMYFCFNVVSGAKGHGEAVLIRAAEPLAGADVMQANRNRKRLTDLASGPGKLCQAFAIGPEENGLCLCRSRISIVDAEPVRHMAATPRIGIREATDRLYRFVDTESNCLSRPWRAGG